MRVKYKMIINCIIIFFSLLSITFVNSLVFWLFLKRKVSFSDALKLTCVAVALNKLLFSGSGYVAMSWRLKDREFSFYRALSIFAVFELFSVLPWLIVGFSFGAGFAVEKPLLPLLLLSAALISIIFKRDKVVAVIGNAKSYLKEINLFLIVPLAVVNLIFGVIYYFSLFRVYGFLFNIINTLKIATISFSAGYLSPAPSGLGFKDGSLVFLLMQKGITLKDSLSFAITDRAITTIFYLILGLIVGAEIIKSEIKKRLKLNRR